MGIADITGLDQTIILCTRLPETRAFYRDILKFEIEIDQETWVTFRAGPTRLTLRPRGPWSVCDDSPIPPQTAAIQLAFTAPLAAIDECHTELLAHGIPILREPTDLPKWRHLTLFFRDPENNIIEIFAEL